MDSRQILMLAVLEAFREIECYPGSPYIIFANVDWKVDARENKADLVASATSGAR